MLRRDFLRIGLAASAATAFPFSRSLADDKAVKVLYFSNSAGFEHEPVKIVKDGLSVSDIALQKLGAAHNIEVVCTKDGKIFDGDLTQFRCFAFYTSGDLLKGPNAMSAEGKKRFLAAIDDGIGFLGFHAATDTWRTNSPPYENPKEVDPYIAMIGGEFISHGPQQEAVMKVTQPAQIPWLKDKGESFKYFDEWYAHKSFNKDMHVILTQETEGMNGKDYNRPPFPATWARMQKKGRVLYTSMGHRNEFFQDDNMMKLVRDCFGWVLGEYDMDVTPNIDKVTPGASILQR
ncbi:MAG: ThuA domain-containing protein [Planctomycetaceae bacterium]|nr:ThuA domain-containing protein [Planctomycetaceae bacterium]